MQVIRSDWEVSPIAGRLSQNVQWNHQLVFTLICSYLCPYYGPYPGRLFHSQATKKRTAKSIANKLYIGSSVMFNQRIAVRRAQVYDGVI